MSRYDITIAGNSYAVEVLSISGNIATVKVNGVQHQVQVAAPAAWSPGQNPAAPAVQPSSTPSAAPEPAAAVIPAPPPSAAPAAGGSPILAPLPGSIVNVLVNVGDRVSPGSPVVVLEAMKMENEIRAHVAGTVAAMKITKGQSVKVNDVLLVVAP